MSVRRIPFLLLKEIELLWAIVQVNFSAADLFTQYQLVVVLNLQEVNNCWSSITKKKKLLLRASAYCYYYILFVEKISISVCSVLHFLCGF